MRDHTVLLPVRWSIWPEVNTTMARPITGGPRYKGFSSVGATDVARPNHSRTETYDIELVKQDILNHFNVRYREVPGRPGFGCGIYNLMAEPFDDITEIAVREEVERVLRYDPRVDVISIDVAVDRDNHGMRVSAHVRYLELDRDELINLSISPTG